MITGGAGFVPAVIMDARNECGHDNFRRRAQLGRRLQGEEALYYLYVLASRKHGTLYIGVTGDLPRRLWEHREGLVKGFTSRYGVTSLVYYELFGDVRAAIQREKTMKKWPRQWKVNLIERDNPQWADLYPAMVSQTQSASVGMNN